MRPPSGNRITQGQHLTSKAVDYSASPDPYVYAPENGRVDSYQYRGTGTNSAGNVLRIQGATGMHSLCHLETSYVSPGQTVTKGQRVAKMGYTGYTIPSGPAGTHLHYYVLTPVGYKYPPTLYTESFNQPQGGNKVFENDAQIQAMYYLIRGKNATAAEVAGWRGNPIIDFAMNQYAKQEVANREAHRQNLENRVNELTVALQNEQNKPPREVIKEVEKIVEVPVEVPVNVPITPEDAIVVTKDSLWDVVKGFFGKIFK